MKAFLLLVSVLAIACCRAEDNVQLRFQNADVKEVIGLYEKLTKCHIVTSNLVIGSLNVSAAAAVPPGKAIELIETALFANGFSIVQTKPDTIRILGIGENPASGPLPTLTKPEEIPVNERVVRYVHKLKVRDLKTVMEVLQRNLYASHLGTPTITTDDEMRALLIVDRSSGLREILKLIGELDQAPPK